MSGVMTARKRDFLKRIIALNYNALSETEGINKKIIEIPIEISNDGQMPTYAHPSDAGMDIYATEKTREHNDANFVAFGGRVEYKDDVLAMLDAFLDTPFSHDERHQRRIDKMMALQGK